MTISIKELFATLSINDTQNNDTQHIVTQHIVTQHNDTQHNDTQHNDTQHNDTQPNDTLNDIEHNEAHKMTYSITTLSIKGLFATLGINDTQHRRQSE
jgi:hypothetical protein